MSSGADEIFLEPEEEEFLKKLLIAYVSLPRDKWQDFIYNPALTRVAGAQPRVNIEKAIDAGGIVSFRGEAWHSRADIPENYDQDTISHPGLPNNSMRILPGDIHTLKSQDLIGFTDDVRFFVTSKGRRHIKNRNENKENAKQGALTMTTENSGAPKAFISYSWEDEQHKAWVYTLAAKLRAEGVDITLDQWHAVPGDQLPAFMERAIRESNFALIVCTPKFKEKSDARQGGVGYEGDIMTGQVFTTQNQKKFIPILRKGEWSGAIPTWLEGKYGIDLRGTPYSEEQYDDLLVTIHGLRPQAPPVGPIPERLRAKQVDTALSTEPIHIMGIVVDEVSEPRNDGTKGSALYKIPFQLSQRPSSEWASLFVKTWNHPPQFTTMHRPGIASINGDKIILNGTTIDEVEKFHRETLKIVIERVNGIVLEHEATKKELAQAEATRREQHEAEIRDKASRLKFD